MLLTPYGATVFYNNPATYTYRRVTQELWQSFLGTLVPEADQWTVFVDDFLAHITTTSAAGVVQQWHANMAGTSAQIDGLATDVIGGIVRIANGTTANSWATIALRTSRFTRMTTAKQICLEAVVSLVDLAASNRAIIGLVDAHATGLGTEVMADTSLAVTSSQQSLVALAINGSATAPTLDLEFCRGGSAAYRWGGANLATLAKTGYVRVGFLYNPSRPVDPALRVFVNGVSVLDATTAEINSLVQVSGTSAIPTALLTPLVCVKTSGASAQGRLLLDWIAVAAR